MHSPQELELEEHGISCDRVSSGDGAGLEDLYAAVLVVHEDQAHYRSARGLSSRAAEACERSCCGGACQEVDPHSAKLPNYYVIW